MNEPVFKITADIIRGMGMGRTIGYPTINLVYPENSDFENGVYFCRVSVGGGTFYGVMHLGPRHTLDGLKTFEIHLLDFDGGELYGMECFVEVFEKLRDVEKFDSVDALREQIGRDIQLALKFKNSNDEKAY